MITLVLLPGMDGTGLLFSGFHAAVRTDCRMLTIAYPADKALGYRELVAFVEPLLPKNEKFVLLGESFSGPVAIALAALRPPGLIGLVLSCSFVSNPSPLLKNMAWMIRLAPVSGKLTGLIAPFLFGRYSTASLRFDLKKSLAYIPAATLKARLRAVLSVDFSDELKRVNVPILYLQALGDMIVPPSAARYVQSLAPAVRVVALQGPHLLLQVMPDEAAGTVKNFIAEIVS